MSRKGLTHVASHNPVFGCSVSIFIFTSHRQRKTY